MPFQSAGNIRYFQFEQLGEGIIQAVFTRRGGVSPEPWKSLNVGGTVGDDLERVKENRLMALEAVGRKPDSVFDCWQVHGVDTAIAKAPRPAGAPHQQADVILTDTPGITLMMRFADCVPILLFDPVRKVVGIAHAGWMGTVKGTTRAAVEAMKKNFGSEPQEIRAGIGPSIGPDHYEIGLDVAGEIRRAFGKDSDGLLSEKSNSIYLDLWEANRRLLRGAGVETIETAGVCTACHLEDWFSHRAEKGRTGRFGAIIALT